MTEIFYFVALIVIYCHILVIVETRGLIEWLGFLN